MITFITPEVAIGDATDSKLADNTQFNAVLNVAVDLDISDGFKYRHKVGLLDGPGNNPLAFMSAVLLLYSLVQSRKKVLLHCHEGKSRSVMVCATFIAIQGQTSLDDALAKIMPARKVDIYRPALYSMAKSVIPMLTEIIERKYE
jgi:protein-tyrosine phosphatase